MSRYISQKVICQLTSENAKTQSLVTKTVWQRIPGRRARNSKTLTTIAVQVIPLSLPSLRGTSIEYQRSLAWVTMERSTSTDWWTTRVDNWWRWLFVCNCSSEW